LKNLIAFYKSYDSLAKIIEPKIGGIFNEKFLNSLPDNEVIKPDVYLSLFYFLFHVT